MAVPTQRESGIESSAPAFKLFRGVGCLLGDCSHLLMDGCTEHEKPTISFGIDFRFSFFKILNWNFSQHLQMMDEEKAKLDAFCEQSLKEVFFISLLKMMNDVINSLVVSTGYRSGEEALRLRVGAADFVIKTLFGSLRQRSRIIGETSGRLAGNV